MYIYFFIHNYFLYNKNIQSIIIINLKLFKIFDFDLLKTPFNYEVFETQRVKTSKFHFQKTSF